MGRQYSNSRRSSRQSGGVPQQFLVVIITFFLGYLTASVFDIQKVSHWVSTQVLEHAQEKRPSPKTEAQQTQVPPKPKFEFYTLLANEKVPGTSSSQNGANLTSNHPANHPVASVSATHAAAAAAAVTAHPAVLQSRITAAPASRLLSKPSRPPSTQTPKRTYMVQVAAFKVRQDAEHMKGMLILKGFSANVVPVSHQTRGIWYRVVVGPYINRALAQKAQETLARNERLRGMVTSGTSP
jgi:cell division protein FtsN